MSKVSEVLDSEEAREWVSRWLKQQVEARELAPTDEDGAGFDGNNLHDPEA